MCLPLNTHLRPAPERCGQCRSRSTGGCRPSAGGVRLLASRPRWPKGACEKWRTAECQETSKLASKPHWSTKTVGKSLTYCSSETCVSYPGAVSGRDLPGSPARRPGYGHVCSVDHNLGGAVKWRVHSRPQCTLRHRDPFFSNDMCLSLTSVCFGFVSVDVHLRCALTRGSHASSYPTRWGHTRPGCPQQSPPCPPTPSTKVPS